MYPTSLDTTSTIPVETNTTPLSTNHVANHTAMQTAIIAIETLIGITASAVNGTINYILGEITGADKAVGKTATQTITNKTLTSPKITVGSDAVGDLHYTTNVNGTQSRIPIGTDNQILKLNGTTPNWEDEATTVSATYTAEGIAYLDANAKYYGADAGSTDTYTVTLTPAPNAYVAGQVFNIKFNTVNTGAATLNINGLGAKTIVKEISSTLADGDIQGGQTYPVFYDGTNLVLQTALPSMVSMVVAVGTGGTTTTVTHNLGTIPRYAYFRSTPVHSTGSSISTGMANWNKSTGAVIRQNCVAYNYNSNGGVTTFVSNSASINLTQGSSNNNASVGTTTTSAFTITHATTPGNAYDIYIELYA